MKEDTDNRIGSIVRKLRQAKRMTTSRLAGICNVSENTIRAIEVGRSTAPSFPVGLRIARALGVSPESLVEEEVVTDDTLSILATLHERLDVLEEVVRKVLKIQELHQAQLESMVHQASVKPHPLKREKRALD